MNIGFEYELRALANDFIPVLNGYPMSLTNIKSSLNKVSKSLAVSLDSREYLLKNTRDVVILCSQSIIAAHNGELDVAKKKAVKANKLLAVHRKKANSELAFFL